MKFLASEIKQLKLEEFRLSDSPGDLFGEEVTVESGIYSVSPGREVIKHSGVLYAIWYAIDSPEPWAWLAEKADANGLVELAEVYRVPCVEYQYIGVDGLKYHRELFGRSCKRAMKKLTEAGDEV